MHFAIRAPLALALSFSLAWPLPSRAAAAANAVSVEAQDPVPNAAELVAPLADASQAKRMDAAKRFYSEAEAHAANFEWQAAIAKYEAAYSLTPDKHGLAYKVGTSAWRVGDCLKAKDFFEQLIDKGADQPKLADKVQEAKDILNEIERQGCAKGGAAKKPETGVTPDSETTPVDPAPVDDPEAAAAKEPVDYGPNEQGSYVEDEENPLGPSRRASREANREQAAKSRRPGLLAAGIAVGVLGLGGLATGGVFTLTASNKANSLRDLSTRDANTLFPGNFYVCEAGKNQCPRQLSDGLARDNQVALISYAVGGGLALVGVTLIVTRAILRARDNRNMSARLSPEPRLTFAPMLAPQTVGAGAVGRF